jgi:hypothetical protein
MRQPVSYRPRVPKRASSPPRPNLADDAGVGTCLSVSDSRSCPLERSRCHASGIEALETRIYIVEVTGAKDKDKEARVSTAKTL